MLSTGPRSFSSRVPALSAMPWHAACQRLYQVRDTMYHVSPVCICLGRRWATKWSFWAGSSGSVMRPSEAALFTEDESESDCMDAERCRFRRVEPTSNSLGDAAGDGRLIAAQNKATTMAKHFCNNPADLVLDSLSGLCALNPHLAIDPANRGASYIPAPSRHIKPQSSTSPPRTAPRSHSSVGAALATNRPTLPSWVRTRLSPSSDLTPRRPRNTLGYFLLIRR